MNDECSGTKDNQPDDKRSGGLVESRSFKLAKSIYSGQAILATAAQYSTILVTRISEDALNYEVAVDRIDSSRSLNRLIGDFLRELTLQQVRIDVERRFGITRDRLVSAAFESRENV